MELETWIILGVCAYLSGFAKASIGGFGIVMIPLMAMAFPGKQSTGVLLLFLIFADMWAVLLYRKEANWKIIYRTLPSVIVGVLLGYCLMSFIPDAIFNIFLAIFILTMLALEQIKSKELKWMFHPMFIGGLAGVATMMANAAGPLFSIYLLALRLDKRSYVGTFAWFFLLINVFKYPFSWQLGYQEWEIIWRQLCLIPIIVLGSLSGYGLLKMIPLDGFQWMIRLTAVIGCVFLLIRSL